ncbi:MAG TPA: FtsX-like permease family protein, partial [Longimicrobiales bacterium]|nr:FtsX-like permease family protein [Longimicrobiales bacterium]
DDDLGFVLHPLRELTVGSARASVLLLLGAVTMLLLLSCANVANLYLAHGVTRTSELTVRSALGATRSRLVLQLFGESLCTAALAGALGAGLAALGVRAFLAYAPAGIPRLHEITLDQRALGFVLVLTLFTAVFFGSVPALRGSRLASALAGTRVTASQRTHRLQAALVGFAVAASLVLVTASALLLNSFRHLVRVDPGFDGADVITAELRPPAAAETHAEELLFYRRVMERAQALPGVAQAALMHTVPGIRGGAWSQIVTARTPASVDRPTRSVAPALGQSPGNDFVRINPVYGALFQTLDIPLLAGAAFAGDPGTGEPLVVLLNEAAAQRFFPDVASPIGEHIALGVRGSDIPMREVVGIVGNVHQSGVAQPAEPQIYLPYGQRDINRLTLVIEMKAGARLPVSVLRQMVAGIAPEVPVDRVDALATRYAASAQQQQFLTFLLSVFAALSLALAVVGTYATASHALSRRLRELAIRMALGAPARNISRLVFARSLLIAGGGIAAGLLLTLVLTRFLEGYVYGITTRDPLTFTIAAVLLVTCVILASLGPAVRATRVDPNDVLRSE